jgi:hypothetical protein
VSALLRAELQRAAGRRLVRAFALLSIVGALAVGIVTFTQTSTADGAAIAQKVHVQREEQVQARKDLLQCLYDRSRAGQDPGRADCQERTVPGVHDPRLERERVQNLLRGTGGILALVAWVIGASLMGAEQQSRSITTTLTFAPRRTEVFAAKAVTALIVVAAWAMATLAAVLAALLPAAILHAGPALGQPGNLAIAGVMARGVALCLITTTMGFALASLGRNTAAALGVGFGYIIVVENILGSSIAGWRRWLLLGNVIVFVSGKTSDVVGRSPAGAAAFLVAVAAVLLVASAAVFGTRDVA